MFAGLSNIVLVISVITILCFSAVYITMFTLYYTNRKKVIDNKLEDKDIEAKLNSDIYKYNKKNKNKDENYKKHYYKTKHRKEVSNIVGNIILGVIFIIMLVGYIWSSVIKSNDQQLYINNKTYLVIQTSSMETVNSNNSYIESDKDQNKYLSTRINQYSLIGIEKYTSTTQLNKYDIVAFKAKVNNQDMTIVHRLLEIKEVEGNTVYTFRGDANPYSQSYEINVTSDKIIGVYNGFKSLFLGHAIIFLQSGVGLITIFAIIIVLLIYVYYYDKIELTSKKRYELLLNRKFPEVDNKHYTDTNLAKINTQELPVISSITPQKEISDDQEVNQIKEEKVEQIEEISLIEDTSNNDDVIEDNSSNDINLLVVDETDSRYDLAVKSHKAKICSASDEARSRYNEVKNYIMKYKKVNCRFGKQFESYNLGKNRLFLMMVRNKNVTIYFNLDPKDLDSKYYIEDMSNVKKYSSYPAKFVIKSSRGVKFAYELIDKQLEGLNPIENPKYKEVDYLADLPKLTDEELFKQGEIKKVK